MLKYKYAFCSCVVWLLVKNKSVKQGKDIYLPIFTLAIKHYIESILAIRDVGIQIKTSYWGGASVSRFINRNKIQDIIINEAISFWQIKSYMAILVKDEDKMVVAFEVTYLYICITCRNTNIIHIEYTS